ncbi:hypothetical protein K493DRAFT_299927 [Basidiobolus meristosporus CBS 931.73]|uniref:Uncharacterized protein n=1 Tax=Basidiobolus meristosporus CBS 931.73 TaxID=1314790 RepID=A0A1Y1YK73_9FUNG|nr:hypothetical protein K493DRAFT_299927 [Basidiobolus meristosporus CBS 931.73]|eukprot:ORX98382.1 hypothetical protein K493DRAFT_299927 [Basidiobolus meristosporus CBS 931.73]
MKSFFACILAAVAAQVSAAPTGANVCSGWSVSPLETAGDSKSTFASGQKVTLKWDTLHSQIEHISEVGLFSAENQEFLHIQYSDYPGISAKAGELTFELSVPLCLQKEGKYYLGVYGSTAGEDSNCSLNTESFELTADPNGDYSVCKM